MFIVWLLDLKQHKLDVQTEINTLARLWMIEFERGLKVKTPKRESLGVSLSGGMARKRKSFVKNTTKQLLQTAMGKGVNSGSLDQRVALFKHLMMLSVFDTFKIKPREQNGAKKYSNACIDSRSAYLRKLLSILIRSQKMVSSDILASLLLL